MRHLPFIICRRASAGVEFAFILPALIMLIVGTFYAGIVMCSISSLHSSVEAAARCASVNSSQCGAASGIQAYGQSRYYGMSTPTFTTASVGCGHQVSASLNLMLNVGIAAWSVPVSATSCYP